MPNPKWCVKHVQPKQDYSLTLLFEDGSVKVYDMRQWLDSRPYQPLKDLTLFMQARVFGAGVVWNDEIDIAPEELYENGITVQEGNS